MQDCRLDLPSRSTIQMRAKEAIVAFSFIGLTKPMITKRKYCFEWAPMFRFGYGKSVIVKESSMRRATTVHEGVDMKKGFSNVSYWIRKVSYSDAVFNQKGSRNS
ncbi:uncharacterized protein [Elaeis guineensis]|uniref:uncharacterized protein isoform X5 n=1 Tax=Elaeis guineensis var. tenera TaxID=51953 RepID=UPI003C6CFDAC